MTYAAIRCDAVADGLDDAPGLDSPSLGQKEFAAIVRIMQSEARIHLSDVKRTLVHSRLSRRLRMHRIASFADYLQRIEHDPEERAAMVVALTTNHTFFFRENHHFEHLRGEVIPRLKEAARSRPVRLWSAGSSSGEEVYSIAMCLSGANRHDAAWLTKGDVRLLATDLSPPMVATVQKGVYPANAANSIPEPWRSAWTKVEDGDLRIAPELRALVTARTLNLFERWPMRQSYDVIFCRNVMIYFDDKAKAELEARLADMLRPGGFLYIGHSERLIGAAAVAMKSCGHTIYSKNGGF